MKKNRLGVCFLVMAWLFVVTLSSAQESSKIKVTSLPDLPSIAEARTSFGFAGMVGEMHKDALITAGGANFPNALPWEGGKKIYSDSIYLLIDGQWQIASEKLPTPLAYAASVSVPEGIPVMGGENGNTASSAVFLVHYDVATKTILQESYPPLHEGLAYSAAVVVEGFVYVVGGKNAGKSVNSFYRLSLKEKSEWETLADFPGEPRALHTAVIQETKDTRKLFVIGGRNQAAGKKSPTPTDYL